jgi:hypothetical protein
MNDEAQVMKSDMIALSESVHPSVRGKELPIYSGLIHPT